MGFGSSGSSRFSLQNILNLVLRFLQIVFALAVVGLYAQDLNKAHKVDKYSDSRWGFATAVAVLSAITALVYAILPLLISSFTTAILFGWDAILFILWTAIFGLFGSMYINVDPGSDGGISRMKNAVWIDLINMLLWFVSAIVGGIGFWRWRKGSRSLHTGRATL
ncbi:hypothetical protein GJ744_000229 [Endocarpon pusillum]|uniref:MARVEL domain-containing protein n=1 Tax=Endocarpon pusillum TaxID=364733 RepID=A0A8H7AVT2_9EURO|nr:hypothetical protein GJ744_000229 [Endocarpon pusillum]